MSLSYFPIVKKTRAAREELLEQFNYNLDSLCAYLDGIDPQREKKAVTLDPRRPVKQRARDP